MAIDPMTKDKVMRPSLIDAVDKINELVTAINTLDPTGIDSRITALETSDTVINGRIDGALERITTAEGDIDASEVDIEQIKTTLYTPLSQGGN